MIYNDLGYTYKGQFVLALPGSEQIHELLTGSKGLVHMVEFWPDCVAFLNTHLSTIAISNSTLQTLQNVIRDRVQNLDLSGVQNSLSTLLRLEWVGVDGTTNHIYDKHELVGPHGNSPLLEASLTFQGANLFNHWKIKYDSQKRIVSVEEYNPYYQYVEDPATDTRSRSNDISQTTEHLIREGGWHEKDD